MCPMSNHLVYNSSLSGISSAGRALRSGRRGRQFESVIPDICKTRRDLIFSLTYCFLFSYSRVNALAVANSQQSTINN